MKFFIHITSDNFETKLIEFINTIHCAYSIIILYKDSTSGMFILSLSDSFYITDSVLKPSATWPTSFFAVSKLIF